MAAATVADAVIVGGGISGIMSAYYLAAAGLNVLLIERGVLAGEASGRNGGHVSPSTYDPAQRELGNLALRLWPELVQEIELPTEYVQGGALSIFLAQEAEAFSERRQRATGGDEPIELLDAGALRGAVPHAPQDAAGAVFMPKRGNVNPILAAKSFAAAAESLGATIWEGISVTGVAVERDVVVGVHTTRGYVATPLLVNCAGAWAAQLGKMVGLTIPVIPHRLQILITEAVPAFATATFSGANIYARQARAGQVHFGLLSGPAWDPPLDRFDRAVTLPTLLHTARQMAALTPGLADVPVLRSWAGVNSITPDGAPVVDAPAQVRGFIIAAGFWNGFGIGVATGRVVSELALGERASVDISGLALDRFERYPPGVLYPYARWRSAPDADAEAAGWPVAGTYTRTAEAEHAHG